MSSQGHNMVSPEKLKQTTPLSQLEHLPLVGSTGIIQLFCHYIATWYAMSRSHVKLMAIGTSCGCG